MIVAFAPRPTNPLVALIRSEHRRAIMNFFLFVLEIFLVVAGIALVPARSELRVSRTRVIHNEREQENSLRS
jgi:P pilus assembly chaperone PapD